MARTSAQNGAYAADPLTLQDKHCGLGHEGSPVAVDGDVCLHGGEALLCLVVAEMLEGRQGAQAELAEQVPAIPGGVLA